ncbi:UNVERIFIED_CONTAM: hypothetical protein Sangu_0800200 [Sesamum angustifolium]|uniref:ARM repeat superfamily protein n=1 Tax=Sesamum angustifolium TaxID=2727405 RepID=A0AAW2PVL8_9LAMI
MAQEEELQLIGLGPGSGSGPMVSATVGRVMTTLLQAKPKKLQDAISRLQSPLKMAPLTVSLEQSLWFLHKYIGEAAERGEHLDQVLVPIIQHSLTMRVQKQGNQVMILLNWLFQDEILFQYTMRNLAGIISKRDDHYVALGWCILGRSLIEYESVVNNVPINGSVAYLFYGFLSILFFHCDQINETVGSLLAEDCYPVDRWSLNFISYDLAFVHIDSGGCTNSCLHWFEEFYLCLFSSDATLEGFELPTRLAVAAADFILSLTVSLTRKDLASDNMTKKQKSSSVVAKSQPISLLPGGTNDRGNNTSGKTSGLPSSLELKLLLWDNLNQLIPLVEKLTAWSRKSRSLHAKGLERVFKWLQEVKQLYGCFQYEAEMQLLKNGALLLSSCWKHYGMLMHLEDQKFSQQYKELLDQYLSGIQFYADNQSEEPNMSKDSKSDTINFFLNCLLLLLGRLDNQQFGNAITEFGSQISQVLMSQHLLFCLNYDADEEVIDGAINIFKAVIFRTNHAPSKQSVADTRQMDALLAILLDLLDERDAAAKAIVKLVAEICSIKHSQNPDSGAAAHGKEADGQFSIEGTECIAALMINRALSKSEFEDVRKLASELCGRIHPKVLVPVLSSQLESAADAKDTLKIRVCLFSLCTSLMIRLEATMLIGILFRIRKTIQKVLSWTSSDKEKSCRKVAGAISEDSVLAHVINQLTDDEKDVSVESDVDDCTAEATVHLSFRLCMANVLISACQKIQDTGKKSFVRKILPRVICAVGVTVYPEIRAACIQVLFAVAYHLKSSIFPYSNDLLTIALKSLGEGSYKEKMRCQVARMPNGK